MSPSRQTNAAPGKDAFPVIVTAGLTAGILDLSSAFILAGMKGRTPLWLLQYVASGLLGARSFEGGLATAVLGAVLHFMIAFGAAAVFFIASGKVRFLTTHTVLSGLAFGVAVHAFMNLAVLPLSLARVRPTVSGVLIQLIIHVLLIGLPISLIVRRFKSRVLPSQTHNHD